MTTKITLPAILLMSVLAVSACATKKEEPVVTPAAPEVTANEAPMIEPAPVAKTEEQVAPAPKPAIKKHLRKKARPVPPKPVEAAPVEPAESVPPPALAPFAKSEPAPAPSLAIQTTPKPEESFLEKYWLWLLVLIIAIAAIIGLVMKKKA